MTATQPREDTARRSVSVPRRLENPLYTEAQSAGTEVVNGVDLLPAELLDGGEVVIFAVKPSLWFVVLTSVRWLTAVALVILLVRWFGSMSHQINPKMVVQGAMALGAARVGFALLQWVSRLYVLTNRRIMRLKGILNVELFECHLSKVQNTYLTLAWYERLLRVGTISFTTAGTGGIDASWIDVNTPLEIHEQVRAAIHRAQRPGAS